MLSSNGSDVKRVILSEYDEAILAVTNPNAAVDELLKIKAVYAEQLAVNESRRAELKDSLSASKSRAFTVVDAVVGEGHMFGTNKGNAQDLQNLKATDGSSGVFARFQTLTANQSVWAACQMSGVKAGTVWVSAKLGPNAGSDNYVVVYKATWLNPIPILVGSIKVTQPNSAVNSQIYVVGTTDADYKYLIVGTASINPATTPSDIMVDTIGVDY
jgi:hypothetical protein